MEGAPTQRSILYTDSFVNRKPANRFTSKPRYRRMSGPTRPAPRPWARTPPHRLRRPFPLARVCPGPPFHLQARGNSRRWGGRFPAPPIGGGLPSGAPLPCRAGNARLSPVPFRTNVCVSPLPFGGGGGKLPLPRAGGGGGWVCVPFRPVRLGAEPPQTLSERAGPSGRPSDRTLFCAPPCGARLSFGPPSGPNSGPPGPGVAAPRRPSGRTAESLPLPPQRPAPPTFQTTPGTGM